MLITEYSVAHKKKAYIKQKSLVDENKYSVAHK